jgi:hypothetical protein
MPLPQPQVHVVLTNESHSYVWNTSTLVWDPETQAGGAGGGDGAILDGAVAAIKATVLDYANSNPLAVRLTDTAGDYIAAGAGTQYTEDVAAAADPIGTALILVRKDTPAATVSTDGDNIAQRGTNFGAAYVTLLDAAGAPVAVGGGTQYTEDVASAADPIGTQLIARRRDTLASETTTDGDNTACNSTAKGELYVKHVDAIPVTNAGTFVVQENGAALTALQLIDDPVVVLGTATYTEAASKGNTVAAVRRDADTTLVDTTNELAPLQVDARGCLKVEAFSGETLPVSNTVLSVVGGGTEAAAQRVTIASDSTGVLSVDDNGGSLTVDGTVAVSGSVAVTNAALGVTGGGVEATALRVTVASDSTGVLSVDDNGASLTVDNAALSVVGGGVEAAALRVTIANDSTGVVSVDDNGGSLTVDGTVAVSGTSVVDARRGTTLLFGSIDTASSGDNTLVAADAAKKAKLVSYTLISEGTVAVRWKSAANNKSGAMPLITNTGLAMAGSMDAWLLETAVNEALILNLSAAIGVRGHFSYILEA